MYYAETRKIYAALAKKYDTRVDEMADICRSPLEFVVDMLHNKAVKDPLYMPAIRITGLGVFYVTEGKKSNLRYRNYLNKKNGSSEEEVQSGSIQSSDGDKT